MRTSWQRSRDGSTAYVSISAHDVTVGEHAGSGHTDNAGSCSHAAFLGGQWHDQVRSQLGADVLAEVLLAIAEAQADAGMIARRREVATLRDALAALPYDAGLPDLLDDPLTVAGVYGNLGGYRTQVRSDSLTLEYDSQAGELRANDGLGRRRPVAFPGHASQAVAWRDWFCVCVNQDVVIVRPDGAVKPATATPGLSFGAELRIEGCARHPETWILRWRWLGNGPSGTGLLRYDHGRGAVAQWGVAGIQ